MNQRPHILVIEDDIEIRSLLRDYLAREGFRVDVGDGGAALDRFRTMFGEPDLVVLDIMLPGEDGLSICRRLRAGSRVPILMLTAKSEDIDRIVGLEMGADDYLPKPFNPARAGGPHSRHPAPHRGAADRKPPLPHQRDAERRSRQAPGRTCRRQRAVADQCRIRPARCFLARPNRVLSREQLMDWTRGRQADPLDRTIDVQVSRLRKKIERNGELIKTVRSAGYVFTGSVKEA